MLFSDSKNGSNKPLTWQHLVAVIAIVVAGSFVMALQSSESASAACNKSASNDDPCITDNFKQLQEKGLGGEQADYLKAIESCRNDSNIAGDFNSIGTPDAGACSNAVRSCLEAVNDRSVCFNGNVLKRGAFDNGGNIGADRWEKYSNEASAGRTNQEVRQDRYNSLKPLMTNTCTASSPANDPAALQACINDKTAAFDKCYDDLGGNTTSVSNQQIADCMGRTSNGLPTEETLNALDNSSSGVTNPNANGDEQNSCRVEGVGWLICPVTKFMANIADKAYDLVLKELLAVQPLNVTAPTSDPLYQAWSVMRNLANIAFVVAFLIIIYSQITNVGITNYGIKKLLPRLIIAAILVNLSYWICALAVDASNILGSTLN
ncbi:MAG: hypothetical protein EOO88_34090, partial [Pedobacter sp.]